MPPPGALAVSATLTDVVVARAPAGIVTSVPFGPLTAPPAGPTDVAGATGASDPVDDSTPASWGLSGGGAELHAVQTIAKVA
jgi:hypothetical protein